MPPKSYGRTNQPLVQMVESKDEEFNKQMSNTIITMFLKEFNKSGDIEKAMNTMKKNPIIKIRGLISSINQYAGERNLAKGFVKEINDLYPEHRL